MSDMLNKYQAIVMTAYTGIMMVDFSSFHADVESRFGRPIWTHEFGDKDFMQEVANMYREDFLSLCNSEN